MFEYYGYYGYTLCSNTMGGCLHNYWSLRTCFIVRMNGAFTMSCKTENNKAHEDFKNVVSCSNIYLPACTVDQLNIPFISSKIVFFNLQLLLTHIRYHWRLILHFVCVYMHSFLKWTSVKYINKMDKFNFTYCQLCNSARFPWQHPIL